MKKVILGIVATLLVSAVIEAQEVRRVSLDNFFQGIELTRVGQGFDFVSNGRSLRDHVLVSVPAGTLKLKFMYRLQQERELTAYIVTLENDWPVEVKDGSGERKGRKGSIRLTYACKESAPSACREALQSVLRTDTEVQSLGVGNLAHPSSDILPEQELIFTFFMRETGKFK